MIIIVSLACQPEYPLQCQIINNYITQEALLIDWTRLCSLIENVVRYLSNWLNYYLSITQFQKQKNTWTRTSVDPQWRHNIIQLIITDLKQTFYVAAASRRPERDGNHAWVLCLACRLVGCDRVNVQFGLLNGICQNRRRRWFCLEGARRSRATLTAESAKDIRNQCSPELISCVADGHQETKARNK